MTGFNQCWFDRFFRLNQHVFLMKNQLSIVDSLQGSVCEWAGGDGCTRDNRNCASGGSVQGIRPVGDTPGLLVEWWMKTAEGWWMRDQAAKHTHTHKKFLLQCRFLMNDNIFYWDGLLLRFLMQAFILFFSKTNSVSLHPKFHPPACGIFGIWSFLSLRHFLMLSSHLV